MLLARPRGRDEGGDLARACTADRPEGGRMGLGGDGRLGRGGGLEAVGLRGATGMHIRSSIRRQLLLADLGIHRGDREGANSTERR